MSDNTTIARPYARAIFNHALACNQLKYWAQILQNLASVLNEAKVSYLLTHPDINIKQQSQIVLDFCHNFQQQTNTHEELVLKNFIFLLAANKRLLLLPQIASLFAFYYAEYQAELVVQVTSFTELTEEQQQNFINALSVRLQKQITLVITIDRSILGGAIIQAGDLVIDGSVRSKLRKLLANLTIM